MKVTAITIRAGQVVFHEGKAHLVLKTTLLQPGKGSPFVQADLRNLESGLKINMRWRTQENVERAHMEERPATFLYAEGDMLTFMDQQSFEQCQLPKSVLEKRAALLTDGMEVLLACIDGKPRAVKLPATVTVAVEDCEPAIKGQTAASSYKPATVRGGLRVSVPPHINPGDRIVIATEDMRYSERAKD